MKRIVLSAALFLSLPLAAQTDAKPAQDSAPKPPAVPVITDALKARFFKAQSFESQASVQAEKAQGALKAAIDEMRKVCGESSVLQSDQTGDPVCVAKPSTEKK